MVLTRVISGGGGSGGGGGVPSGPAGGDLSGTYPDPEVANDSHSHTGATISGDLTLTRVDVDNIRLDGNAISTTNANGDLTVAPNGTGSVIVTGTVNLGGEGASYAALVAADSGGELWVTKNNGGNGGDLRAVGYYATSGSYAGGADQNILALNATAGKLGLAAGAIFGWGSAAAIARNASLDTVTTRAAAGVQLDGDGSGGLGSRLTGRVVEASTAGSGAPNVLAVTESRKLLTNEGCTAEAYNTLPAAAAGIEFVFYCQDADGIRVTAGAGDTIRLGAVGVSAAGGFIRTATPGAAVVLAAINATEWVALSIVETWTIDI